MRLQADEIFKGAFRRYQAWRNKPPVHPLDGDPDVMESEPFAVGEFMARYLYRSFSEEEWIIIEADPDIEIGRKKVYTANGDFHHFNYFWCTDYPSQSTKIKLKLAL